MARQKLGKNHPMAVIEFVGEGEHHAATIGKGTKRVALNSNVRGQSTSTAAIAGTTLRQHSFCLLCHSVRWRISLPARCRQDMILDYIEARLPAISSANLPQFYSRRHYKWLGIYLDLIALMSAPQLLCS